MSRNTQRLEKQLLLVSQQLADCLFHENPEIILETTRVLGIIAFEIDL